MKLRLLHCALALTLAFTCAFAQVGTPQGAASDATNQKIHKLDLLIKLVPMVLKKSQCDALLAALDKARAIQKDEQEKEDKVLADIDPSLSDAVKNAVEKGIYPPRDFQEEIASKLKKMSFQQIKAGALMIKTVFDAINSSLNEGQRKTMAGSFSSAYINSANPASVTEDIKLDFYVKTVFLDPDAYDLLKEISKHAT